MHSQAELDRSFLALSHPVRRAIVERLVAGPATVGQASSGLGVSKPAVTKHLFRFLLFALGSLSVGLGVIGIFIPLMPTTVFLLLAAACYARSSDRFYQRLIANRWLGSYIRNSREGRGMSRRHKAVTLALVWIGMLATGVLTLEDWWARALLAAIAVGVTIHVARLPVAPPIIVRHPHEV